MPPWGSDALSLVGSIFRWDHLDALVELDAWRDQIPGEMRSWAWLHKGRCDDMHGGMR